MPLSKESWNIMGIVIAITWPSSFRTIENIVSKYDQEISQYQNVDEPMAPQWKSHATITRQHEDKVSKATSSLCSPSR